MAAALSAFAAAPDGNTAAAPWEAKVAPRVWADLDEGDADFLVVLAEQADLSAAESLSTKEEKGAFVVRALQQTADRTQRPIAEALLAAGAQVRPFWVANFLHVRGGYRILEVAARMLQVSAIEPDVPVQQPLPTPDFSRQSGPLPSAVEWNITKTRAPEVWGLGYRGQGIVIAGQDTGYLWSHSALKGKYRGWNGTSADHNYNWHDSVHSGGGSCGANATAPCDDYGHGTHTMGTMVGDDGGANQVGMAPGATWIGCRNMDVGNGTPTTYSECFQWFLAPTNLAGQYPDTTKAPDVINNSWGCPPSEGCTDVNVLKTIVENCRAAGIVVVVSAGNSGSACSTINDPPGIYAASFSVGATDSSDAIASFSSRGPVTVDGSNRLKPDVSAPGVNIRSSTRDGSYQGGWNGTSMAGPHVAGLVALYLSARPDLLGKVSTVEEVIRKSTLARTSLQTCGGVPGSTIPNNTFGWGRIDAYVTLTGDADGDGANNLADCSPADAPVWASPTEALDMRLAGSGTTAISWQPPASPGCSLVYYDLLRSAAASDFSAASCLVTGGTALAGADANSPSAGAVFFYLVRAKNDCGSSLGVTSSGTPRTGVACL